MFTLSFVQRYITCLGFYVFYIELQRERIKPQNVQPPKNDLSLSPHVSLSLCLCLSLSVCLSLSLSLSLSLCRYLSLSPSLSHLSLSHSLSVVYNLIMITQSTCLKHLLRLSLPLQTARCMPLVAWVRTRLPRRWSGCTRRRRTSGRPSPLCPPPATAPRPSSAGTRST